MLAIVSHGTGASCHPGGREDGHVWQLEDDGPRRTQSLAGTLEGTAPYHWDGKMVDLSLLMGEIFTERMAGAELDAEYEAAFASWLLAIPPPPTAPVNAAGTRGQLLFESEAVGCAGCHAGAMLTSNETVDVGTGLEFGHGVAVARGCRHVGSATSRFSEVAERARASCRLLRLRVH